MSNSENRDLSEKSRVMREYQARFCERFQVQFLLPTRQLIPEFPEWNLFEFWDL